MEEILLRLQKLESESNDLKTELKRERDINRALQYQIADMNLNSSKKNFNLFHRNKNIQKINNNLNILQKLLDHKFLKHFFKDSDIEFNPFHIIDELMGDEVSGDNHLILYNYFDYYIDLFNDNKILLNKIIHYPTFMNNEYNDNKIYYENEIINIHQFGSYITCNKYKKTENILNFLDKEYICDIINDIDENKLLNLLNEYIISIIQGIYRINNDTIKDECSINYFVHKYRYIIKPQKYDTNYIYFEQINITSLLPKNDKYSNVFIDEKGIIQYYIGKLCKEKKKFEIFKNTFLYDFQKKPIYTTEKYRNNTEDVIKERIKDGFFLIGYLFETNETVGYLSDGKKYCIIGNYEEDNGIQCIKCYETNNLYNLETFEIIKKN